MWKMADSLANASGFHFLAARADSTFSLRERVPILLAVRCASVTHRERLPLFLAYASGFQLAYWLS